MRLVGEEQRNMDTSISVSHDSHEAQWADFNELHQCEFVDHRTRSLAMCGAIDHM